MFNLSPDLLNAVRGVLNEQNNEVTVSLPLLIRLMEYAREDAPNDEALHFVAERAMKIGGHLTMDHYRQLTRTTK